MGELFDSDTKEMVCVVMRNVTDRKRTEEAFREMRGQSVTRLLATSTNATLKISLVPRLRHGTSYWCWKS